MTDRGSVFSSAMTALHTSRNNLKVRESSLHPQALLGQTLGRTPRQNVEKLDSRYGFVKPATIEPLTDFEFQMYEDPIIRRPDNYDERLRERNRQETIARKAEVAVLKQRVAVVKERQEGRLYSTQRYVAAVREQQAEEERRRYGF